MDRLYAIHGAVLLFFRKNMLNWFFIQEPILEKDARQFAQVAWLTGT